MGARYPCVHGNLCCAYMRRLNVIYDRSCPDCEFYIPDVPFEPACCSSFEPALRNGMYDRAYREGYRASEMAHSLGLVC